MPSFDVVCEADMIEVKNAIEQSNKEISTRFDFKGSDARVEHKESEITAYADDDFKLGQVKDVLLSKMAKRNVDVRFLDYGKIEKIGGDKVKQVIKIKKGVSGDLSKKIVRLVKDSKIKVQASIQGDAVRVSGGKRDDLQSVLIALTRAVRVADPLAEYLLDLIHATRDHPDVRLGASTRAALALYRAAQAAAVLDGPVSAAMTVRMRSARSNGSATSAPR